MKKKSKKSGIFLRIIFRILGQKHSINLLGRILKKRVDSLTVSFPIKVDSIKEILIILPEDPLQVLYQLRNVITLTQIFRHSEICILCEHNASSYVKMIPGLNIIEYDSEECRSFSQDFISLSQEFKHRIDICFLLEKNPLPALLYLTVITGAPIRLGYYGAGSYPFLNLRFRPDNNKKYLPEINNTLTTLFGISQSKRVRWSVARKTIEEIDQLIKESKINRSEKIFGLDPLWFYRKFGASWTEKLIKSICSINGNVLYLYTDEEPEDDELAWLSEQKLPVFSNLSAQRTAALLTKSELIITGNTILYALAGLLEKPAIGLFEDQEFETYCPQSHVLKGISYTKTPDQALVDQIASVATGILRRGSEKFFSHKF